MDVVVAVAVAVVAEAVTIHVKNPNMIITTAWNLTTGWQILKIMFVV